MTPFRTAEDFMEQLIFEDSEKLGQGSFGDVYLVEYEGQEAALKLSKSRRNTSILKEF